MTPVIRTVCQKYLFIRRNVLGSDDQQQCGVVWMNVEIGIVKSEIKGVVDHRHVAQHRAGLVIESVSYEVKVCDSVGGLVWLSDVFMFQVFPSSVYAYDIKRFYVGECEESSAGALEFVDLIDVDLSGEVTVIYEAAGRFSQLRYDVLI